MGRRGVPHLFSEPGKAKLRNIAGNPAVSLNLNSIGDGGVAVFTGEARLSPEDDDPSANRRYIEKYRSLIEGELASTVEAFATAYRVAIRVKPVSLRAW